MVVIHSRILGHCGVPAGALRSPLPRVAGWGCVGLHGTSCLHRATTPGVDCRSLDILFVQDLGLREVYTSSKTDSSLTLGRRSERFFILCCNSSSNHHVFFLNPFPCALGYRTLCSTSLCVSMRVLQPPRLSKEQIFQPCNGGQ